MSKPGLANPGVPGAAGYRVVHLRDGGVGDEEGLLAAARRAARGLAASTLGDPEAYSLLFHGGSVRRVPWPHVHVVVSPDVPARRRALGLVALKGPLRRFARPLRRLAEAWRRGSDRLRIGHAARCNPEAPRRASPDPQRLRAELQAAWTAVGAAGAAPFDALVAAWSAPHRRYHTLGHLAAVLAGIRRYRDQLLHPHEAVLAAWFHDVVQVPGRRDDEARSAAWARRHLRPAGVPGDAIERIVGLVLATAGGPAEDGDAAWFVDVDRAVLGAPPRAYAAYVAEVRAEFGWVSEPRWRRGRAAALQGLLAGGVYRTGTFRAAFESRARRNLEGELRGYRSSGQ